jgi:hypothetical protein
MVTDIPTSLEAVASGRLSLKSYVSSLLQMKAESVFASEDLLPTFAEIALLPYLAIRRGY